MKTFIPFLEIQNLIYVRSFYPAWARVLGVIASCMFFTLSAHAQCGSNTQLGAACSRSNNYFGEILPNNGCGVFTTVTQFPLGQYFRIPVLTGACYTVSTCGSGTDTQLNCFQGSATTGPFAWNDDNGPECIGTSASLVMRPNFTDYATVQVNQYNCLAPSGSNITVYVRQYNNLSITSSSAAMCAGQIRSLTATPAAVSSAQSGSGELGAFTGTGVSGTNFTAPTPAGSSAVYTITYSFGYCTTTQNITVFRAPSSAAAGPDQSVNTNSTILAADTPAFGAGTWSLVSGAGTFTSPNSPTSAVTNLGVGANTFRWTVSNGPCTATMDDVTITYVPCPPANIIYVNANATGANSGASWTNAFTDLQSALNSTCPGITQIWVAAGTYKPTSGADRNISFVMKNGLAIYGGFSGNGTETMLSQRNWTTNVTTLSGDIGTVGSATDNSYHVIFNNFTSGSPLTNGAVLDGFTITGAMRMGLRPTATAVGCTTTTPPQASTTVAFLSIQPILLAEGFTTITTLLPM